ncbi:MAG: HAD-IA family hydrolase [Nitrospirota bacterium]|jgi:phosphoglycolate phosphatase
MPVRLIIFDLDGTLVDTARDIQAALNGAVKPLGLQPLGMEETIALIGEGTARLIEKALRPLGPKADDALREETLGKFLRSYSENLTAHSRPYPDVKETLLRLRGFQKAVLSNKGEELSRRLLEAFGLAGHFALIAGSDTTKSRKPSPEPVRFILKKLGFSPEEALVVGDSPYDIEAAQGAGAAAVAVTYGYRGRSLLVEADHVIDSIEELLPLLVELEAIEQTRREPRYPVPPGYRDHIELRLRAGERTISARLLGISESGVSVETPAPLEPGSPVSCELSMPHSLTQGASFSGTVRHSGPWDGESYRGGIEIDGASHSAWFRVFGKVMAFVATRPEFH